MKKTEVKVDGIVYTVSASTEEGLKMAVKALKKSIKIKKEQDGRI